MWAVVHQTVIQTSQINQPVIIKCTCLFNYVTGSMLWNQLPAEITNLLSFENVVLRHICLGIISLLTEHLNPAAVILLFSALEWLLRVRVLKKMTLISLVSVSE